MTRQCVAISIRYKVLQSISFFLVSSFFEMKAFFIKFHSYRIWLSSSSHKKCTTQLCVSDINTMWCDDGCEFITCDRWGNKLFVFILLLRLHTYSDYRFNNEMPMWNWFINFFPSLYLACLSYILYHNH